MVGSIDTKTNNKCKFYIHSVKETIKFLESLNITVRKSKTLVCPNISDLEQIRLFILGYFDEDGGLNISKGKMSITISGTRNVLEWIDKIFKNQLDANNGKIRQKRSIYELEYHAKKDVKTIMSWLFNNTEFSLERKRIRYFNNIDLLTYKRINNATISNIQGK